MALREILIYPDDRLKIVAQPVNTFDQELHQLIDDMFETMYKEQGIGLAATQVNVHRRVIVIDIEGTKENQIVLINPKIIESSGETGIEEGCLSLPGLRGFVPRKEKLRVEALDKNGKAFILDADDLLAICIQHEIDHLNGIVFADYLSPLKRQRMKDKLIKLKKQLGK
ncbi:peptide deformylase [Avibacterium paragallinarum]|uniref:Peptide deformylase n=2 Tax=Avibacterium paragallinarum TaxID=728 RepID=A0A2S5ATI6_AVIPA|nr:peptide deformylase [Avibacterium paragallinarum]MEE3607674.1 peptide deformylase [Avibacterium paragallinarum]MEE3620440.1 peptide deformylase [Avibacterium paragallinarum]MEE3668461.1 peptide deformylase [Avibacterium paragallinarum]MEE3680817.1 peptide deformylase [Avibacterium paragallinarum]MEE4385564.1 peptide deformylase [Avibacterium paragallinarum]